MTERVYCSRLAAEANADPAGTAVQVEVWLLLEYPRPWKPRAMQDNDLSPAVQAVLDHLPVEAQRAGVEFRIQFIKQAASADIVQPRVFVADDRAGQMRLTGGVLDDYGSIAALTLEKILAHDLPRAESVTDEIYLVCTNGQRDVCCARFGLPLFETLRIAHDSRIWQTTHLGGHRYAPNLLCLPSGYVYGFVAPEQAEQLVAEHDQGRLAVAQLRGRSALPKPAQAAEIALRKQWALGRIGDVEQVHVDLLDNAWQVRLRCADGADAEFAVRRQKLPEPILASCGAEPKVDYVFQVDEALH
ncbi:MAG: sucrase ferredoxin [Pseudomonadota bacterium]